MNHPNWSVVCLIAKVYARCNLRLLKISKIACLNYFALRWLCTLSIHLTDRRNRMWFTLLTCSCHLPTMWKAIAFHKGIFLTATKLLSLHADCCWYRGLRRFSFHTDHFRTTPLHAAAGWTNRTSKMEPFDKDSFISEIWDYKRDSYSKVTELKRWKLRKRKYFIHDIIEFFSWLNTI